MEKKLTKHGNSLALVLDKPILDLLGIDADTTLSIVTDGQGLYVTAARGAARKKAFREALAKFNRKYGAAMKRLAD